MQLSLDPKGRASAEIPIEDDALDFAVRKVQFSSQSPFCLTIAESVVDKRILSHGCYPAGDYVVRFDDGESRVHGAPGRYYALAVSRAILDPRDPSPPPPVVFLRASVETTRHRFKEPR